MQDFKSSKNLMKEDKKVKSAKNRLLSDVPGWLNFVDQMVMKWILEFQSSTSVKGDLIELGVYQGKSAIHIGQFINPGERFIVCDLFDDARSEQSIREDARHAYRTLTQQIFEENYLDFHSDLPLIVQGLSSTIEEHVEANSCRFIHIDASHAYEHVSADAAASQRLLREQGVAVFDDYRTEHTIGTAAAVWESVINNGFNPICVSAMKFYGTWGDPAPYQEMIYQRLAVRSDLKGDVYKILHGMPLIRVLAVKAPPKAPAKETEILAKLADLQDRVERLEAQ